MSSLLRWFAVLFCVLAMPALAEQRVALVIGNNAYPNLPPQEQLQKAINDANAVGDTLERLGFTVIRGTDLGRGEMLTKLSALRQSLKPGDLGFVFFSGHGVAIDGANYLLPSDIPGQGDEDVITQSAVPETYVEALLSKAGVRTGVLVLDACRNNPFAESGNKAIGGLKGLVRSEPPGGVFKLYAAGTGEAALDRLPGEDPDPNSVFTRVLLPELEKPGRSLVEVAYAVKAKVTDLAASVGHKQHPAQYDGGFAIDVYLAGEMPAPEKAVTAGPDRTPSDAGPPVANACAEAKPHYDAAVARNTAAAYQAHLKFFGSCAYAPLAEDALKALQQVANVAPDEEAAPAPERERPLPGTLLRTIAAHSDSVSSVAVSPDGQMVASGSPDGLVKFWRAVDGRLLSTYAGHFSAVNAVAFHPRRPLVASGGGGDKLDWTVRLFRPSNGSLVQVLSGHGGPINSVAFGPDGELLASGSDDDTIKLWRVSDGRLLLTLGGHDGDVQSVAFSPNGKILASGSSDSTIRLWDVSAGRPLRRIKAHDNAVLQIAFSADSRMLASASLDGSAKLWDASAGLRLHTLEGHGRFVASVAFSPDGALLASGSGDRTIRVWSVSEGDHLHTLKWHGGPVRSVAFGPDGRTIASGSTDRTIKLWIMGEPGALAGR